MTHGTRYAYRIGGCHCAECRSAMTVHRERKAEWYRDYMRRYRAAHRDRIRQQHRESRARHIETVRTYDRERMRRIRAAARG